VAGTGVRGGDTVSNAGYPVAIIPPGSYTISGFRIAIPFPQWGWFIKLIIETRVTKGLRGIIL